MKSSLSCTHASLPKRFVFGARVLLLVLSGNWTGLFAGQLDAQTIGSITPVGVAAGTNPGPQLTLNGSGFNCSGSNSSVVFWNAAQLTPTCASGGILTVQIPAEYVTIPDVVQIRVSNGAQVSNAVPFYVAGVIGLASVVDTPAAANNSATVASTNPVMSGTGRLVAFASTATNLAPNTPNGGVFVRDTCIGDATGCLPSISNSVGISLGIGPPQNLDNPIAMTRDGRFVFFIGSSDRQLHGTDTCVDSTGWVQLCTPTTVLVSENSSNNGPCGGNVVSASVSDDGNYVAFDCTNNNGGAYFYLIFVRECPFGLDRSGSPCTQQTLSVPSPQLSNSNQYPSISADGRFIAFQADVPETSTHDLPNAVAEQVFVADMCIGAALGCQQAVTLISAESTSFPGVSSTTPLTGAYDSYTPVISADGNYVAFWSNANDLVFNPDLYWPRGQPSAGQVYLATTCARAGNGCLPANTLVSVGNVTVGGSTFLGGANASSTLLTTTTPLQPFPLRPAISGDGRYVAFVSPASNLVPQVGDGKTAQVYLSDMCVGPTAGRTCTPTIQSVSIAPSRILSGQTSFSDSPVISENGRFVAYTQGATDLAGAPAGSPTIVVHDTCIGASPCTAATIVAPSRPTLGNDEGVESATSSDGRFVAFSSNATNLAPGVTPLAAGATSGSEQIYLRDTCYGQLPEACTPSTTLISANLSGTPGNCDSQNPTISGSGQIVAFESAASNLVGAGSGPCGARQIYVYNSCGFIPLNGFGRPGRCQPTLYIASRTSNATPGDADSSHAAVSKDGNYLAYQTLADNLSGGRPGNTVPTVMVEQLCPTPSTLFSTCTINPTPVSDGMTPSISGNGRYVAYVTVGTTYSWVYVQDTCGGTNAPPSPCTPGSTNVSVDDSGNPSNANSWAPSISADGSTVAFESSATNLVSGFGNGTSTQVYLHGPFACTPRGTPPSVHCTTKTIALYGPNTISGSAPSISANGRYVAYEESVGGPSGGDIRVADTCANLSFLTACTGSSNIASTATPKSWITGPTGADNSVPSISGDGHVVTFPATGIPDNIAFALTGH